MHKHAFQSGFIAPCLPTKAQTPPSGALCLQDGARRNRVEAEGLGLPFRPLARLTQDEELGCTCGEARGGRGLGQMTRPHSLPFERWGENRPPKGKGGPRFGSVDKGWCCHERGLNDSESC